MRGKAIHQSPYPPSSLSLCVFSFFGDLVEDEEGALELDRVYTVTWCTGSAAWKHRDGRIVEVEGEVRTREEGSGTRIDIKNSKAKRERHSSSRNYRKGRELDKLRARKYHGRKSANITVKNNC